ncbi:MAG: prohibitin family protein [Armatimonadetes bacterium]|nr:prohibitin family protein [Armatimonadota bacterium]
MRYDYPRSGEDLVRQARRAITIAAWIVLALLVIYLVSGSTVTVGAGERAVVFNRITGVQKTQLDEGLHILWPVVQQPVIYDVKTATYTMSGVAQEGQVQGNDALTALTADGQMVALDMSVRYHVDPEYVWRLHQRVGREYEGKIIRPQVRSHTRMVVSGFKVTDVYSGRRAQIQEQVKARLAEAYKAYDIILDEVLLRDVKFSETFQQTIEQKQVAQQEVQAMEYILDQTRKERDRKIIEAEGTAEAIRLKTQALAENPQLAQYEYVQKLPANVRTVITDSKTILNFGDLFTAIPRQNPEASR